MSGSYGGHTFRSDWSENDSARTFTIDRTSKRRTSDPIVTSSPEQVVLCLWASEIVLRSKCEQTYLLLIFFSYFLSFTYSLHFLSVFLRLSLSHTHRVREERVNFHVLIHKNTEIYRRTNSKVWNNVYKASEAINFFILTSRFRGDVYQTESFCVVMERSVCCQLIRELTPLNLRKIKSILWVFAGICMDIDYCISRQ